MVFRGEGEIEDFPGNYSDFRIYEDSAEPVKDDAPKEKVNWKDNQPKKSGLSFNEQKEFSKIEREIKDLEYQKKQIEDGFSNGTVSDNEMIAKGLELQKIIET